MAVYSVESVTYTVKRRRCKGISIRVRTDGSVWVSAPWYVSVGELKAVVQNRLDWIKSKQEMMARNKMPVYDTKSPEWKALKLKASARFEALAAAWVVHFKQTYGVTPTGWSVRNMHTRWGSCSLRTGRIALSAALYEKPDACVEFIIVHELCHLIHPNHGKGFYELLNREYPQWKTSKELLNSKR